MTALRIPRRVAIWGAATIAVLAVASLLSLALPPLFAAVGHFLAAPLARRLALATLKLASLCTLFSLLLGAPLAWALRLATARLRLVSVLAAASPPALGLLARLAGLLVVLGEFGLFNLVLRTLQIETRMSPRAILFNEMAVLGGMVQVFTPFMVLAMYRAMARIDLGMVRALRSLGMSHAALFFRVAVPLSRGGAAAGVLTVFALSTGAYVTVALFGHRRVEAFADVAYEQSTHLIGWQVAGLGVGLAGLGAILGAIVAARWLGRAASAQRRPNNRPAASRTSA